MENDRRRPSRNVSVTIACVTLLVLLLAVLALHDIGQGEADLTAEYGFLVVGAGWVLFVSAWLFRIGRRALGVLCILALAGVAWGTRYGALAEPLRLGPYATAIAGFVWLILLSGILLGGVGRDLGRRSA